MNRLLNSLTVLWASTCLLGAAQPADPLAPVIDKYTLLLPEEMGKMNIVGLGVALVDEHGVL